MKKYEKFTKKEIEKYFYESKTYKEFLIKLGYSQTAKSKNAIEIIKRYQLDENYLKLGHHQKYDDFSEQQLKEIILNSYSYKEALNKLGYKGQSNCNYIIDEICNKYNISIGHFTRKIDLTGEIFGKWKVLKKSEINKDKQNIYWICECICGNKQNISTSNLLNNKTFSCGCCKKSKGEIVIKSILEELKIDFIEQYVFNDLKSYKGYNLYFDFYIPKLNIIIEYQGQQHYIPTGYLGGQERFDRQIKNDNIKREYCKNKNIKLIEIPYTDYNKINKEYLKELLY